MLTFGDVYECHHSCIYTGSHAALGRSIRMPPFVYVPPVATENRMQGAEDDPAEVVAARAAAGNVSKAFTMMAEYMQIYKLRYDQHT